MDPVQFVLIGVGVISVAVVVLTIRCLHILNPGWRFELFRKGQKIRTLDRPGFYFISPLVTVRKLKVDRLHEGYVTVEQLRKE